MIDPTTITNFNRTEAELEEFLMFAILVAGKTAKTQAKKLDSFLQQQQFANAEAQKQGRSWTPFDELELQIKNNYLTTNMMEHKLGQYKRLLIAFLGILRFKGNLKNVSVEELESIKGIGSKTARFFLLHSRKDVQFAVLDTHILKWLREQGYDAPKATPTKKKYAVLEKIFLTEAWKREMLPADLDLLIWKSYATPDAN
jgi:thermostable 8-oxoguanine DNA glycosylase